MGSRGLRLSPLSCAHLCSVCSHCFAFCDRTDNRSQQHIFPINCNMLHVLCMLLPVWIDRSEHVTIVCLHTQMGLIAGGLSDGSIGIWDPAVILKAETSCEDVKGALVTKLEGHKGPVYHST